MSLITFLFKNMPVEPKPRKGLYYVTVFMPLCIVCRQKQQVHLMFQNFEEKRKELHYRPTTLRQINSCFSRFLITTQT